VEANAENCCGAGRDCQFLAAGVCVCVCLIHTHTHIKHDPKTTPKPSRQLSDLEKTSIRDFVSGKKENPWPDKPAIRSFKLRQERLVLPVLNPN